MKREEVWFQLYCAALSGLCAQENLLYSDNLERRIEIAEKVADEAIKLVEERITTI